MNLNDDKYSTKPLVTKEGIYKYISDVDIYHKYCDGIQVELKGGYFSPLRDEKTPSFGFFRGTDEICFKDFLLGSGGPVEFVMLKYGISYVESLSKIIIDFNIEDKFIYKKINLKINNNPVPKIDRESILDKPKFTLTKRSRKWKHHDIIFWSNFGITLNTLKLYNVAPVEYIFIGDKVIKAEKYSYCYTEYKDGIESYKIYQPYSANYKWINTHDYSVWQGWEQLPAKANTLIITKSLKDVMALRDVCRIASTSLQCENVLPKPSVINSLKSRFNRLYLLYDNDFDKSSNWGQIFANKLSKELDIENIYINSLYKSTDISDLIKNHGVIKARKILFEAMDNILPF